MDHVALSCSDLHGGVFVFVMNRRDGRKNRGSIMLSIILFSICWLVVVGANNSFTRKKTRRNPDLRPDLFRNSREDKEEEEEEEEEEEGKTLIHHFETRKRLIFC